MKANTDNTIGRFRAAINQAEGFARQSRFAIRILLLVIYKTYEKNKTLW